MGDMEQAENHESSSGLLVREDHSKDTKYSRGEESHSKSRVSPSLKETVLSYQPITFRLLGL